MNYETVVVGAGPAGATAAKFLAEKGVNVLLLDKSRFPRDKPCAGVLSIRTLKRFPYISEELISSYSYECSISSSSLKNRFHVQMKEPISAFVVRKDFDHGLVKLAVEGGATLREGVSATDMQLSDEGVILSLDTGESVQSPLVIGADGIWSMIAKKSGIGQHYPHIGRCLYQEVPLSASLLDEYFTGKKKASLFVKFMGVDGFGWVVPKNECVNIGIGEIQPSRSQLEKKHPLKEVYQRFIRVLIEEKVIPPTISSETMQGGALPVRPFGRTYRDRVVLCGDAAGQMNPLTGDGIHYAMSAGMFAADVCAKALETGTTDASLLSQYQRLWKRDFGYEIKIFHLVLTLLLKGNRDETYIRILSKDPQIFGMLFTMANTQGRIQDYQWKVLRRFIPLYLKDFFGI
jgi:geranylgeranyl reductase family protein